MLLAAKVKFKTGPRHFVRALIAYSQPEIQPPVATTSESDEYQTWLIECERVAPEVLDGGLVSVVMPVYNPPIEFLRAAVESVRAQSYRNWELCIHDDGSTSAEVRALLTDLAADPRIKVDLGKGGAGIADATNAALALASGEWACFLDHDDLLHPAALSSVVAAFLKDAPGVVYTDHDIIDERGARACPFFKPDWSHDLFMSQMYLGHLVVVEMALVRKIGGLRRDFDGSQDYDLVLRCVAAGARVSHVSRVLYHWRAHAGSTAANASSKPYAHHAGRAAIQAHVDEMFPGARVSDGKYTFCYDVRYPVPVPPPLVSIIIPTRDGLELLKTCIDSIRTKTSYCHYEILIVDNGSTQPETIAWLAEIDTAVDTRVLAAHVPFNWSRLNNIAARSANGDVLLFLNNDTEVISGEWLGRLVENALRPEIAVCGPLLLYGDGSIQHAGVVVGMGGWADHVFKAAASIHHQHLFVSPALRRNVLAVTGACMAIERGKFESLGGFDERFAVCGSDVELCLRGFRAGYSNLYVAESVMIHHESKTRDPREVPQGDFEMSMAAYAPYREKGDPFFSPNLDPMSPLPRFRPAAVP
ncbi:glycosyltransferase family 2 protein [Luteimonas aestuarii]|uniref:Glycosyltransferase family 2 protein n=2 Tax=Luteimonas aestuarii TaxID=453837 RepID=A0A4R5TTY4_9GAMM|nr:glycosyltransferase family 2 protein [Luteimonas aestuarii]